MVARDWAAAGCAGCAARDAVIAEQGRVLGVCLDERLTAAELAARPDLIVVRAMGSMLCRAGW
jgi:hypothetical protein